MAAGHAAIFQLLGTTMSVKKPARRPFAPCRLSFATALVLYGSQALAHSAYSPHAAEEHVVLPPGIYAGAQQGATLVHDYGAFQLWRVDAARRAELSATAPQFASRNRAIDLPAAQFDPLRPQPVSTALSNTKWPAAVGSRRLYVVQFAGPIVGSWLDGVRAAGATLVQYVNNDAYLVLADDGAGRNLTALARSNVVVRYAGEVAPQMKISSTVSRIVQARPGENLKVAVVVAQHSGAAQTQAAIDQLGTRLTSWSDAKGMNVAHLEVSPDVLPRLAAFGDVMTVSMVGEKRKYDETQTRILTGDFTAGLSLPGPSTPSYFDFLADTGLSTTPGDYPVLAIVDDGIGNGTTAVGAGQDERLTVEGDNVVSRIVFATSCSNDSPAGVGGHGHLNATIAAGYDDRTGFPFTDAMGNLRGLGVNPYARVANFQIFGAGSSGNCGSDDAGLVAAQGAQNVRISSNSWGYGSIFGPATDYLDSSRFHDLASRDNSPAPGDQPTLFVYAAGNDAELGVSSPGNAKNTLNVGASENQRPTDEDGAWNDGCNTPGTEADDAMDVATFSSLGPAVGGRAKPEVIAPGTHVQGSASTSPDYDGTGVCDEFRPSGQTEFASSTGTSHSTPAVAGVQTLYHRHLQNEMGAAPSPAMLRAFTIAHPIYLTGDGANDNLPSDAQGYGQPNLTYAFDGSIDRYFLDQSELFTAPGQVEEWFGSVTDTGQPVRVVLAWTDPAAAIDATDPLINDLDLRVTVNGQTYRGNNFTGQFSNTSAPVDDANNVEVVFLPAGTAGAIEVEVESSNIAADAVAGNASPLDQDYALVIVNGSQSPTFVVDASPNLREACGTSGNSTTFDIDVSDVNGYTGTVTLGTANAPGGTNPQFSVPSGPLPPAFESVLTLTTTGLADGNYVIDVTGTDALPTVRTDTVSLQYSAAAATAAAPSSPADDADTVSLAPNFTWTASVSGAPTSYTLEVSTTSNFSNIVYTAEVAGTSHVPTTPLSGATEYFWRVTANNSCGGTVSPTFSFTTTPVFCDVPGTDIPDNTPAGITRNIVVAPSAGGEIADLDVSFRSDHSWIGDLIIRVAKDGGAQRTLMDRPGLPGAPAGCNGLSPNIVMDDEGAAGSVESGCVAAADPGYPVPQGHYTPNQTLAVFDTQDFAGTWTFTLSDNAGQDTGEIQELCLVPTLLDPDPVIANADAYPGTEDTLLTQGTPGVLQNDTTEGVAPLTATLVTPPASGALDLETDGSFTYMPASNVCGPQTFTYTAGDGTETSQPATVTLTIACVNDAPQAQDDAYVGSEGVLLSVAAAQGVLVNDSDVENSPLTAAIATQPTGGVVLLATNGSFTYLPGLGFCGDDSFTYRANDGAANSVPATVDIDVQCDNAAPVAGNLPDVTVAYGQPVNINGAQGYSDPDGDTMEYSATGLPASLSINPTTGAITGTPTQAELGPHNVTVTAEDPDNETASDSFTLTVAAPPVFANGFE